MGGQFGSIRTRYQNLDWEIAAIAGGSLLAGQAKFYVQGQNLAGRNLLSEPKFLAWGNGSAIAITFNPTIRASGEELYYLIVSVGGDRPAQIAKFNARGSNRQTLVTFPQTIYLEKNSDLESGSEIANLNSFPSNPIPGAIRFVSSEADFFEFDGQSWKLGKNPDSTIAATTDIGGSDRPLSLISNLAEALPEKLDGQDSAAIVLWFANGAREDGGSGLSRGYTLDLQFSVNGSAVTPDGYSYSAIFAGKAIINFLGYVRLADGTLDAAIPGSGSQAPWFPDSAILSLSAPLRRGYAASYSIFLRFSDGELNTILPSGAIISLDLYAIGNLGFADSLGFVLGDCIFNQGGLLRIVPGKRLGGSAIVGGSSLNYFRTPILGDSEIYGTIADTAQFAHLNAAMGGAIRFSTLPPLPNEAIRAIVSTEIGVAAPSAFSAPINIAPNGAIAVSVQLPISPEGAATIREDYPDRIAGYTGAIFNCSYLLAFVRFEGNIYRLAPIPIGSSPSINFSFADLGEVAPLPTNSADFNLWGYGAISLAALIGGALPAGSYEVAIAYYYPEPNYALTKIDHSESLGCISELSSSFAEVFLSAYKLKVSASDSKGSFLQDSLSSEAEISISKYSLPGGGEELKFSLFDSQNAAPNTSFGKDAAGNFGFFQSSGGGSGGGLSPNQVNAFSRAQYFEMIELLGDPIDWDLDTAQVARIFLDFSKTLNAPLNLRAGGHYTLFVKQGSSESSLYFNSLYVFPIDYNPTVHLGSGVTTIFSFVSDGQFLYGSPASYHYFSGAN